MLELLGGLILGAFVSDSPGMKLLGWAVIGGILCYWGLFSLGVDSEHIILVILVIELMVFCVMLIAGPSAKKKEKKENPEGAGDAAAKKNSLKKELSPVEKKLTIAENMLAEEVVQEETVSDGGFFCLRGGDAGCPYCAGDLSENHDTVYFQY